MKKTSPIFLGNWKMNFRKAETTIFFEKFNQLNSKNNVLDNSIVGFAPPFTLIDHASTYVTKHKCSFVLGAQNVHWAESGAHTGEISAGMLQDFPVRFAILGHSERRNSYGETNENVALRTKAALSAGLSAVVCVGESQKDFNEKKSNFVVLKQLEESLAGILTADLQPKAITELPSLIVAYEPIWAIGTGLSASPQIAEEMCSTIANYLTERFKQKISVLYGGSVDQSNVQELYKEPNIAGFLVGGASLKPAVFTEMITSCIS